MGKISLETIEKTPKQAAMLIVDKEGVIGEKLISLLVENSKELQIVFVSQQDSLKAQQHNVLTVLFREKIPVIPDGDYAYMVIVHSGQESLAILKACIKKATDQKGKLICVLGLRSPDREKVKKILDGYKNALLVYVGDIFSKDIIIPTAINRFLLKTKKTEHIKMGGMGLEKTYPVFLDDVALGLGEVIFGQTHSTKNFFLFQKTPPTQLSFSGMLQKINPLIRIDFVQDKQEMVMLPKEEGIYLLPENYPLLSKVRQVFESLPDTNNKIYDDIQRLFSSLNNKKGNGGGLGRFLLFFFVSLALIPFGVLFLFSFLATTQLTTMKKSLVNGDIVLAKKQAQSAVAFFIIAKSTQNAVVFEAGLLGQEKNAAQLFRTIDIGKDVTMLAISLFEASDHFAQKDALSSQESLRHALLVFERIQVERQELTELLPLAKRMSALADVLPDVLGFQRQKRYLVLFQNNMELRPGGGFIGSYGLLTLEKGNIVDFSIHDVYDADGKLKGHVEPPYPIRRYLKSEHWYLRDSNWSVDFPKSASTSAYFLSLETGERVDGVLAIDVSFVKKLLLATGPVYVSDYKELVDENNLYDVVEKHAQQDFFPGSSQKKDFLRTLFSTIREHIASKKNLSYTKLGKAVEDAIAEKHLLFAFPDSSLQNIFIINNMSSSLFAGIQSKRDIHDFLGINEANLGVNKVNYYVSRSVDHVVTLDDKGNMLGKVSITFHNKSKGVTGGEYKNYLRIILGEKAKLSSLTIDGVKQQVIPAITNFKVYEAKNFIAPKETEVEQTIEEAQSVFGFLVNISQNSKKTVVIEYALPRAFSPLDSSLRYNLRLFKQPGIDEYPYTFSFAYPSIFAVVNKSEGIVRREDTFVYKTSLAKDEDLFISLGKK